MRFGFLFDEKNDTDSLHISLKVIKSGTENFNECKCVREGRFWKQYAGDIVHHNKLTIVIAKRWDNKFPESHHQFLAELNILKTYKHENIISLVGYCNEMDEKIIVYESAPNGSLDKHFEDASLNWMRRLQICVDVAKGLEFLHTRVSKFHKDIKTASILLDGDWKAKISNLELSTPWLNLNSIGIVSTDIYSFGSVLKQIMWGRLLKPEEHEDKNIWYRRRDLEILEGIKEQVDPKSLAEFSNIARTCCEDGLFQPDATEVRKALEKALEIQDDYENWKPLLPIDYENILRESKAPDLYNSIKTSRDLYNIFLEGILLRDGRTWFSLGSNGERNEIISARDFSYRNRWSHKWRSVKDSRFSKVAEIIDISNLKIRIKMKKQFISPSVNHKVHLIFRFRGTRKSEAKRMYVNLKYKTGNETLHAYFATWREDGWMMIKLFQYLNHEQDSNFEILLDSFSRCYRGSSSIYIEGIQFQEIDNASLNNNTWVRFCIFCLYQ